MKKFSKEKNKQKKDIFSIILYILFGIILIFLLIKNIYQYETTNNAVVEGRLITVSSRVSGPVTHIYAQETLEVEKGDLLFEIDPSYYYIKLRNAEADLKSMRFKLSEIEHEVDENGQLINSSAKRNLFSKLKFPHNGFSDYSTKFNDDYETQKEEKNIEVLTGPGNIDTKKEKKEIIQEEKTEDKNLSPSEIENEIKRLEAEIEQARLELSSTRVYSPQSGTVSMVKINEGEYVDVGQIVVSLIPKRLYVTAKFKASQTTEMEIGQSVVIKIPTISRRKFKGVVEDIIYPKNVDLSNISEFPNATVNVRIMFIEDYSEFNITPGTIVTVKVKIKK